MKLKLLRRIIQFATIALLIIIPMLNLKGIDVIVGSLYSVAIGPVWITDPLGGFQVMLTTLATDKTLLLSMSLPVAFALIFGRVFCAWMCPQNLLSEIADYLQNKIGIERLIEVRPSSLPRYAVLSIMITVALVAGFPAANLISAPGIISVQISEFIMTGTAGIELLLIGAIILIEFFVIRRSWCNYICPVGALLGFFRVAKTMKVSYQKEADRCRKCGACVKACQLELNPMGGTIYPLCHNCGDCIAACEKATDKNNPLSFRF